MCIPGRHALLIAACVPIEVPSLHVPVTNTHFLSPWPHFPWPLHFVLTMMIVSIRSYHLPEDYEIHGNSIKNVFIKVFPHGHITQV